MVDRQANTLPDVYVEPASAIRVPVYSPDTIRWDYRYYIDQFKTKALALSAPLGLLAPL
jgi:hypothetical protein